MSTAEFVNDLDIELEGGEVESADQFDVGGAVSKAGYYHVIAGMPELEAEEGKLRCLKIDLSVLAGTEESEVNKTIYHRIYLERWENKKDGVVGKLKDASVKGIRRFAHAFGLLSDDDLPKKDVTVRWGLLDTKQAVVEIRQEDDWTDSDGNVKAGGFKIPFNNSWPVGHEKVKDVPKDPEFLQYVNSGGAPGPSDDEFAGI